MLAKVEAIVRHAAGQMLRREKFEIFEKGIAANYASSTDLSIQHELQEALCALLPGSAFVGEEEEAAGYGDRYAWIVDPIDGTQNFVRDLKASSVSVGLVKDGESLLGVIYNPYLDEMYTAEKGKGACLNGSPIHVSDRDMLHSHLCFGASTYVREWSAPCWEVVRRIYDQCEDVRRAGSAALDMANIAAGREELLFEINLSPWDFAAGALLIREAGGVVGTVGKGKRLDFRANAPLLAANSQENYDIMEAIAKEEISRIGL